MHVSINYIKKAHEAAAGIVKFPLNWEIGKTEQFRWQQILETNYIVYQLETKLTSVLFVITAKFNFKCSPMAL